MESATRSVELHKLAGRQSVERSDVLATEEPLEIRLLWGPLRDRRRESIAITMRTPGADEDLARGFLYTEGLISNAAQVQGVRFPAGLPAEEDRQHVIELELDPAVVLEPEKLSRHFYTSSSCGVCGKGSIELLRQTIPFLPRKGLPRVAVEVLYGLPQSLRNAQPLFARTGGIHAAALFDAGGTLRLLREDVGRHNALDKLIGAAMGQQGLPLQDALLLVSGRASFELVQKALMAGLPILAAVGAPSSLAAELAKDYGMTLIGFLRDGQCNLYSGKERLIL